MESLQNNLQNFTLNLFKHFLGKESYFFGFPLRYRFAVLIV